MIRKLLRHRLCEYIRLVQCVCLLAAVRLTLHFVPYKRLLDIMRNTIGRSRVEGPRKGEVEQILWAVNAAGRRLLGDKPCLPTAMVADSLLRRVGARPEILIGVSRNNLGAFEAHAWVEESGQIMVGQLPDMSRFVALQ